MSKAKLAIRHHLLGFRTVTGNHIQLLSDGERAFPAMLQAIADAQRSVVLETYIYGDDFVGRQFADALTHAAYRGVDVRVMTDGVGSLGLSPQLFAGLIVAGGQWAVFLPPHPWRPFWRYWRRNHRKLLIVDEERAFIGGVNISAQNAPRHLGGGGWHDMHACVRGPAAVELLKIFNRTWSHVTKTTPKPIPHVQRIAGRTDVQILESRVTQRYSVHRAYVQAIRRAQHTVRICNAYFIPDRAVKRALINAAARGVRVQLLLAGTTDVPAVRYATHSMYHSLLSQNIEIYEWSGPILHAKTAVVDGAWCTIGSFNLDHRSFLLNMEANIACIDQALGAALTRQFNADIARSERIDLRHWHRRPVVEKILEKVCYFLRFFL